MDKILNRILMYKLEEVMFLPENYHAIVKPTLDPNGLSILLEPTEPGSIEIAMEYKKELYGMGIPVNSYSTDDIYKVVDEVKGKGGVLQKDPNKTGYGFEAVFDENIGNYIQFI
jgi:hypothetical protein